MNVTNTVADWTYDEIQLRENEFYGSKFYFSYSSLNRLLWNPAAFYQEYVLRQKEEKTDKNLLEGKVIHALLLSEKRFHELFSMMKGKLPTENTKQVIDKVFKQAKKQVYTGISTGLTSNLEDYRSEILKVLQDINLHQALADEKPGKNKTVLKTGDDKRMEKILTEDALEYWTFLTKKGKRDVVDQATVDFCTKAVERIRAVPKVMELMGFWAEEFANVKVLNEQFLQYDLKNYPFGIHGIIDNLVIDHEAKSIRINDVKTSGKDLKDFQDSVEYYMYWMQAVIYITLVIRNYQQLIDQGYEIEFRFIVIDRSHQIYPFPISKRTLEKWTQQFNTTSLFKAYYHYQARYFTLPYEFAEELVVL